MSKWEKGITVPDIEKIVQIASILHVSLDELVLGKEPQISIASLKKLIDSHIAQSVEENHWRVRPINNGWEFMARYWWLLFALAGLVSGFYGMFH